MTDARTIDRTVITTAARRVQLKHTPPPYEPGEPTGLSIQQQWALYFSRKRRRVGGFVPEGPPPWPPEVDNVPATYYGDLVNGRYLVAGAESAVFSDWVTELGGTFTRASPAKVRDATGSLVTVGNDVPRFDHTSDGTPRGLLIEPTSTNSLLYSQQFDVADWLKYECSVIPNAIVAPDGTMTGTAFVESAVSGPHYLSGGNITFVTAQVDGFSVYVKAGARTVVNISANLNNMGGWINLATGKVIAGTGLSVEPVGDGWFHCQAVGEGVGNGGGTCFINGALADPLGGNYPGDGLPGLYVWGAQYESNSAFCSSYMPTSGATATRQQDNLSTGIAESGTASIYFHGIQKNRALARIVGEGNANTMISTSCVYQTGQTSVGMYLNTLPAGLGANSNVGAKSGIVMKAMSAVDATAPGNFAISANGGIGTGVGLLTPSGNYNPVGAYPNVTQLCGHMKELGIWENFRASDGELIRMTAPPPLPPLIFLSPLHFNPAKTAPATVLSNHGLTAANGAAEGSIANSQGTLGRSNGSYYCEFTLDNSAGVGYEGCGLFGANYDPIRYTDWASFTDPTWGSFLWTDGWIYGGAGNFTDAMPTQETGDIISVAVNIDIGRAWWRVNGGAWLPHGHPAVGDRGLDISRVTAPIWPGVELYGAESTYTVNFGPANASAVYAYNPPLGYMNWDTTDAGGTDMPTEGGGGTMMREDGGISLREDGGKELRE